MKIFGNQRCARLRKQQRLFFGITIAVRHNGDYGVGVILIRGRRAELLLKRGVKAAVHSASYIYVIQGVVKYAVGNFNGALYPPFPWAQTACAANVKMQSVYFKVWQAV